MHACMRVRSQCVPKKYYQVFNGVLSSYQTIPMQLHLLYTRHYLCLDHSVQKLCSLKQHLLSTIQWSIRKVWHTLHETYSSATIQWSIRKVWHTLHETYSSATIQWSIRKVWHTLHMRHTARRGIKLTL